MRLNALTGTVKLGDLWFGELLSRCAKFRELPKSHVSLQKIGSVVIPMLLRWLMTVSPAFAAMRRLAMRFRGRDPSKPDVWLDDTCGSGLYGIWRLAQYLRPDIEAVRDAISESWSNCQTEGQIDQLIPTRLTLLWQFSRFRRRCLRFAFPM
ncbi:MAG: hypothetical protein ACJ8AW_53590 [Rhodopila sp.]